MAYFLPAGGGGICIWAVAANSSKFLGVRPFAKIQSRNRIDKTFKSGVVAGIAGAGTSASGVGGGGPAVATAWVDAVEDGGAVSVATVFL